MPNYGLVANTTFQPFTYQELIAPIQTMSDYHEKLANEYDTLSKQADLLEVMGQNDRDKNSRVYDQYKNYSDSLRKEADDLYRFGLNAESRQRLSDLRRRYNSEIVPIQNAWETRKQERDAQMKARMTNPDLRFTRDASDTDLKYYINNPMGGYNVVDLNKVSAQMASMAKTLSNQIRSGMKVEGIDPLTYRVISQSGLDPNLINAWAQNPDGNTSPALTNMMNQILEANGLNREEFLNSPNGATIRQEAIDAIKRGAWSAIGEDKEHIRTNEIRKMQMEEDKEVNAYRRKKAIDGEDSHPNNKHVPINPMPVRSPSEVSEANKQIQEYLAKGFIKQRENGQYYMTHEGWQEYRRMSENTDKKMAQINAREAHSKRLIDQANRMPNTVPSAFRTFMDAQNGGKSFVDAKGNALPGWGPNRAGNLFAQAIANNKEGSYDTYHSTEYDKQIPSDYGSTYTDQVWASAKKDSDGKPYLEAVEFNGKNGWRKTKQLSKADLKDYKVTNVRYNKHGDTAILQNGEDMVRVKLPIINQAAYGNVRASLTNADDYSEILAKGKQPIVRVDGQGNKHIVKNYKGEIMYSNTSLTAADRAQLQEMHREALDNMELYGSQYVAPSKTETENYSRFSF